jgi:hypothetical protein
MDAHLLYAHQTQKASNRPTISMATSAGTHTAFFYGTLMAPKVLSRVCYGPDFPLNTTKHGQLNIRSALLQNFRRHRVRHADYPAIVPCGESTVRGTLVTGLTDGDLWRLDIFEGDEYERKKVKAQELKYEGDINIEPGRDQLGATVEAETYVWIGPKSDLDDDEWDFQEFVKEKMHAWVGSSGEERSDYKGEFEVRPSIPSRFCRAYRLWRARLVSANAK